MDTGEKRSGGLGQGKGSMIGGEKRNKVEAYMYIDVSSIECIDNKLDNVPGTGGTDDRIMVTHSDVAETTV